MDPVPLVLSAIRIPHDSLAMSLATADDAAVYGIFKALFLIAIYLFEGLYVYFARFKDDVFKF
jgi:hypothetical protein